jgi:death-on-curing family protein
VEPPSCATWASSSPRSPCRKRDSPENTSTLSHTKWRRPTFYHIAANHPFVDGNKRTALDAALTFLEANDFHLDADPIEVGDLVIALAAGQLAKPAVIEFFKAHVQPR